MNREEVAKRVANAYYNGAISEYVPQELREILELSSVNGEWMRISQLCSALRLSTLG